MYNQDWEIKPRGMKCSKCDAAFEDGRPCVSELRFGDSGYSRADFCPGCWAGRSQDASAVSVWKGLFKAPAPPPPEPLKRETAETLLRRLMESGDESGANVMFILAVMLERRRILVEREVKQRADGTRVRIYEHRPTGDSFVIKDPMLRLDQLQDVQKEVMAMLAPASSTV